MSKVTNPFIIAVDSPTTSSSTGSVDAITIFHNTSSFSSSFTSGSIATIGVDITEVQAGVGSTGELFFKIADSENLNTTGSKLLTLSYSGSNNEPRVGIGFEGNEKPIRPLDVKTKSDSTQGSELLLRSARKLKGAEIGDSAGKIDFVIDSASYNKIEISGSVADIEAFVTDVDNAGSRGDLSLRVAQAKSSAPTEYIRLVGETGEIRMTGSVSMSTDLTVNRSSSLEHLTVGQGEFPTLQVFHEGSDSSVADKYVYARNLYTGINFASGYTPSVTFAVGSGNTLIMSDIVNLGNSSTDQVFISGTLDVAESLHASLSFNPSLADAPIVVYDTASRQFFYTGSYIITGSQGAQGTTGIQGPQGPKGNPGLGIQGPQGPSGIPSTNISASGYISASAIHVENNLAIGGITNVSASIAAASGVGSTPTLQEVTNAGSSTTIAITASIVSASGNLIGILNGGSF